MNTEQIDLEKAIKCCVRGSCTGCPRQAKRYPASRADCRDLLYDHIISALHAQQEQKGKTSTIPCCVCGGEVVEFTVPNDIWNFAMRPDGKETDKEYLCLDCWYKALKNKLYERENPQPLTVEELKERDGIPVYCVDGAGNKVWAVVNASAEDCIDNESGAWIFSYYALSGTDGLYGLDKQLGWFAYDHEPREAQTDEH